MAKIAGNAGAIPAKRLVITVPPAKAVNPVNEVTIASNMN